MKTKALILSGILTLTLSCSSDDNPTTNVVPQITGPTTIIINDIILSAEENIADNSLLGRTNATITNGTATYSLSNISPNGSIDINETNGEITVASPSAFDYEVNQAITATVTVSANSITETANVNISVIDLFNGDEDLQALTRIFYDNPNSTLGWDVLQTDLSQYAGVTVTNGRVTQLNIDNKGLIKIDNTDLYNLDKLVKVFAQNNDIAGTLDFSNNPDLDRLSLFYNEIDGLNVSSNPLIASLLVSNNNITQLDLSNVTSLVDFKIKSNSLTSLNIANGNNSNMTRMETNTNPSLTCIKVDTGATSGYSGWSKDSATTYSTTCR